MSRHRSRRVPRGSMPLPEQPPIYAQNPLGFPLWLPRGWVMKPIWRTRGARQWLVFCLVAPFAILAIAILAVLIHMLLQKLF